MNAIRLTQSKWMMTAALGAACCVTGGEDARGGDFSLHVGIGRPTRVVAEPRRVLVQPEYVERVVAVEVPAVVVERRVPIYRHGYVTGYEYVTEVIEPARTEYRTQRVLVRNCDYRTNRVRTLATPGYHYGAPAVSVGFGYHKQRDHGHHRVRPRHDHRGLRVGYRH